jgi:diacylglycerol kinase (ATP)
MTVREPSAPEGEARSPFKGKTGLVRVKNAFFYSCAGLAAAFRNESAFRQEVLLAAILVPVAFLVPVMRAERAMLVATVVLVLVVELLNACVEAVVDRVSHERHELSGRAKDMGSAAVMVSLILCATVWAIILAPLVA